MCGMRKHPGTCASPQACSLSLSLFPQYILILTWPLVTTFRVPQHNYSFPRCCISPRPPHTELPLLLMLPMQTLAVPWHSPHGYTWAQTFSRVACEIEGQSFEHESSPILPLSYYEEERTKEGV